MYSLKKKIIIATTLLFIFVLMSIPAAFAQPTPSVEVDPAISTINIGDELNVTITINDLPSPGIYSYQLKLYFNTTLLNVTNAGMPTGHFLSPSNPSKIFIVDNGVVDTTQGYVSFAATMLNPELPKNGSGVLCKITFQGVAQGVSYLNLTRTALKLVDPTAKELPKSSYIVTDGQVTVIPELSVTLMALLFLVATAAVVALRHKIAPAIRKSVV
ncbi:MAG TPA: cohesin domain-containing protein [Candidatus Bathyarchaeia archaeon]